MVRAMHDPRRATLTNAAGLATTKVTKMVAFYVTLVTLAGD